MAKNMKQQAAIAMSMKKAGKTPKKMNYGGMSKMKSGGSKFPDLTGDGKVTRADILKGRGVIKYGGARKAQDGGAKPAKKDNFVSNIIGAARSNREENLRAKADVIRARGQKRADIIDARNRGREVRAMAKGKIPPVMNEPMEPSYQPSERPPMYSKSSMYKKGGSVKKKK